MKKYFYRLRLKDYLTLTLLIVIGFGWLLIGQILIPDLYQRVFALLLIMLLLLYIQFSINKPSDIINYSNSITIITLSFIIMASLVIHVGIRHDFSYRSPLLWMISSVLPHLTGIIYQRNQKKIRRNNSSY